MNKHIRIVFTVMIISLTLISLTTAQNQIVDSMDFQGEEQLLSLDKAIEIMTNDNSTIEKQELLLEEAKVNYDKNKREIRKREDWLDEQDEDSKAARKVDTYQVTDDSIELLEFTTEFNINNAKRNLNATIESQKAEIESSYFGLLQAQQLSHINKSNMDVAKDLYDKTQKKFDLGLVAKQEVLNSELNYIKAENQYKQSLNNVKIAKMALNTKLGFDVMTNISLADELRYNEFKIESISEAVGNALTNRNEIKAAEFSYEIQKLNMSIISSKYPEITYQYKEQKVEVEKALQEIESTRKSIEMDIRSQYLDIIQKQEEIKMGQKSVELAEEALRLSQLSYDVGMSILTDVQKAQTAFQQAKLGLSQAILDYNLAVLKFEDSIGVGRTTIQI